MSEYGLTLINNAVLDQHPLQFKILIFLHVLTIYTNQVITYSSMGQTFLSD